MASQRVMRGVLGNFLGAYTSRYSDYDGYWLFGFLVGELTEFSVNLLASSKDECHGTLDVATQIAIARFKDQVFKAGLDRSQIREAGLSISRRTESVTGVVNGRPSPGYEVSFRVRTVMSGSRRYEREQIVFVAPHSPRFELRRPQVS